MSSPILPTTFDARNLAAVRQAITQAQRRARRERGRCAMKAVRQRGEGQKTLALREAIFDILEGFPGAMSSRQVFYQCVSRGAVENNKRECVRVGRLLVRMRRDEARLLGLDEGDV
jgi:hypothetical protein